MVCFVRNVEEVGVWGCVACVKLQSVRARCVGPASAFSSVLFRSAIKLDQQANLFADFDSNLTCVGIIYELIYGY